VTGHSSACELIRDGQAGAPVNALGGYMSFGRGVVESSIPVS
jgi:hypothetical protein